MEFEWNEVEAADNIRKHRVAFDEAARSFTDMHAFQYVERSMNYGEERFVSIGMSNGILYFVVYTERGDTVRLISARRATRTEQKTMTETDRDRERRLRELREMTDEEVVARALADPDAQPTPEGWLATAKRVPRVKTIRRALGMTQEAFAERYMIPLGTLRDWEQGRSEPDQATRAYLKVIAKEPETVSRALGTRSAA